eukprot:5903717-Pyramimonas_sp.AAC.1
MSTMRPMLPVYSEKNYNTAKKVRGIRHDMLGFTDQCIERYPECASKRAQGPRSRRKRSDSPRTSRSKSLVSS